MEFDWRIVRPNKSQLHTIDIKQFRPMGVRYTLEQKMQFRHEGAGQKVSHSPTLLGNLSSQVQLLFFSFLFVEPSMNYVQL